MITTLTTGNLISGNVNNLIGAGNLFTTGNVFYVDSVRGSNGNIGTDPSLPLASLAQAQLSATASNGDVVIVKPGHAEAVTAAAGIAITKAGVSYVGVGSNLTRPTITFSTATTATLTISGAQTIIDNFVFLQTFDAIVSPLVISGTGVTLAGSYFQTATATAQVTQMILTTAAANNLTITNNRFIGTADAGNTAAVTLVGGDNATITDNDFMGAYTTSVGGIQSITTLNTNVVIKRNTIVNRTASATKAITLLTGSTGIISDNRFGIGTGTAPITADAAWWNANYSSAAVATNGTLV